MQVGPPLRAADDVARTNAALRDSMTALLDRAQQGYPRPPGTYWVPRRLGGGAPTLAEAAQIEADEVAARLADKATNHTPHRSR